MLDFWQLKDPANILFGGRSYPNLHDNENLNDLLLSYEASAMPPPPTVGPNRKICAKQQKVMFKLL